MRGVVLVAALVGSACWTGGGERGVGLTTPEPKAAAREPLRLRVRLERTQCFGSCPAYALVINADGRVDWTGYANVTAIGKRQGRVTRFELEELSKRIDRARFFERNEYGELPAKAACQTMGNTTTCTASLSICSDTAHTIISVQRGLRSHTIDNDHCSDRPELEALEAYIERIAITDGWIGP